MPRPFRVGTGENDMTTIDAMTILFAVLLAGLGLALGFARTLRFFTKGIFGFILSIFICATFGGMIAGIPAVAGLIERLNASLTNAWSFLGKIRLETVIYYILLFFAVQIVRILIVKFLGGIFSSGNVVMRTINRVLGMLLMVAAVLLLTLLVFGIFRIFENTGFVQDLTAKIDGTFLGVLYENNPVRFVTETAASEQAMLFLM